MWSRFKRKKPLTLSRWKRFFTPDGRLHNRGVGLLKKVRSRVSLSSIAFVKFDDSVFTKVYGIFIFLMFSCRALILASGQRCGHSFLECKYTHSYSITTTMCDLNSSKEERGATRTQRRKAYERLRRKCKRLQRQDSCEFKLNKINKPPQDKHNGWSCSKDTLFYLSKN
ncbi:hypothetical protein YC2023_115819 [Brassica napus]